MASVWLILLAIVCICCYTKDEERNKMNDQNCYQILGIEEGISIKEVHKVYRQKKREYKLGGKNGENKKAFERVNGCYKILAIPQRKMLYDKSGYNFEYAINPSVKSVLYYTLKNKLFSLIPSWMKKVMDKYQEFQQNIQSTQKEDL